MAQSLIGASLKRREDAALLRGAGQYVDDLREPGTLHLAFVRSPYAHARIQRIDTAVALALPGVVARAARSRRPAGQRLLPGAPAGR